MLNSAPCRYKQRFVLRNYPLSKIMGVNINKSGPEVICSTQLPVDINKDLC